MSVGNETVMEAVPLSEMPWGVPTRVVLVPWGEVESANGGFVVDRESAEAAVRAFAAQGHDLPIDYEHQTLGGPYASPSGRAPAAGWVKRLEVIEGEGVVGTVEWTRPAIEHIAARQYRYLSPVVIVRKSDRRLVALHSAALTNKPAIARMRAIVNTALLPEETRGTREETEAGPMGTLWEDLRGRLGVDGEAGEEAVLAAASQRIGELQGQLARRAAEEQAAEAMKAGKLTTGQRDWAVALILRDPKLFEDWLASAPVVVPHGRTMPPGEATAEDRRRASVAEAARREYRRSDLLRSLTSEEAYIANAVKDTVESEASTLG